MSNFEKVKIFMKAFGQEVKEKAKFPSDKITSLRYDLINEELSELKEEILKKDKNLTELEFGDFLFSVVNYARFLDIDPEIALEKSNKKFTKRFEKIEHELRKRGLSLGEVNIKDLNLLWDNAKK